MPKSKPRGRPAIHKTEPILDTLENVAKAERDKINRRPASA